MKDFNSKVAGSNPLCATFSFNKVLLLAYVFADQGHLIRMTEAWRLKYTILVWVKGFIFRIFLSCLNRRCPDPFYVRCGKTGFISAAELIACQGALDIRLNLILTAESVMEIIKTVEVLAFQKSFADVSISLTAYQKWKKKLQNVYIVSVPSFNFS